MLTKAPRGTKDILPVEVYKWHYIEEQVRKICSEFGYGEIRTPTFEHTELFSRGVGDTTDIVQKEMYTFLDRGERSITLRPEGTASAVRAFIENKIYSEHQPTKLFYLLNAFRYERPQAGRLREFHQFGVEVFGAATPQMDAEVISLAMVFLERLKIENLTVNINSLGCPKCKEAYNTALKDYFRSRYDELCETCRERFERNPLRILDCKNEKCKEIGENAPVMIDSLCKDCQDHFEGLKNELNNLGISYVVDPYIVRGLDYYTRTVFEIKSNDIGAQSTVCGGGRYDNLISECGGPETPAVGFGLGLERLLLTLESRGLDIPKSKGPDLFVASIGDNAKSYASKLIFSLRKKGIKCEKDSINRSFKGQMKYANKIGSQNLIVLGDDEIASGRAKIKNMENGNEVEISLSNIYEEIMKIK